MIRVGVRVMPKNEVLDSQGRAIEQTLVHHGKAVVECRVGKFIELDIDEASEAEALLKAEEIAQFVLCNPLIEKYEVRIL